MSRSYPASTTPAVLPATGYLRLPAPASMSSGSQQLRMCDQGVCKSDTAVKEVELLADVGHWLKENPLATVSSSEQVRAAFARAALLHRYAFILSTHWICSCLCTCASLHPSIICHSQPIALTTVR